MKDFQNLISPVDEYVQKNMIIFLAAISEEPSYLSKLDIYPKGINSVIFPTQEAVLGKDTKGSTRCGRSLQRGLLTV